MDWLFRDGPAGSAPRAVAELDGRIVAHAGCTPLRFVVGGEVVRGGYSVGAMTDSACRGQRLFFRLGIYLYARLAEQGFAFVAGFSNRSSERLMTGPLERAPIRPFPWCIKVLRPVGLARSLLAGSPDLGPASPFTPLQRRGVSIEQVRPDDPRLDALWQAALEPGVVTAVRDRAYWTWRYGDRPDAGYRVLLAIDGDRPVAGLGLRRLVLRGVQAVFVTDLLVDRDRPAGGRLLLGAVAHRERSEGVTLLSALLPGSGVGRRTLLRAGFLPVPEPLHPQVIRFSVRGLGAWAGAASLVDKRSWRLGWGDTDVV